MRKKDKQVMAAALILAVFSVLFLGTRLSYLPQEDISWMIKSVHLEFDNGYDLWREPRGVTFSWKPNRDKSDQKYLLEAVVVGGNVGDIIENGTKDLTSENGTKFRVFWYDVEMRFYVKAIGRQMQQKFISVFNRPWVADYGVKVTAYIWLKARADWRLLDAYSLNISEVVRLTQKDANPDGSWEGHRGTADAYEPAANNQHIYVDGAGTEYARDEDEFWSSLTLVDGKKLKFVAYLRPPELHKYDFLMGDLFAWGESIVTINYVIRVAYAKELPPSTSGLEDIEDNPPDIEGFEETSSWWEQIPWWGWVIIAVAAAWSISSIARAARGGEKIVIVGGG